MLIEHTPLDYLDFASPVAGLGSKLGLDATSKWPGETSRQWGRPITLDPQVVRRVDALWESCFGSREIVSFGNRAPGNPTPAAG